MDRIEATDNVTNLSLSSSLIIGGLFAHFQPHKTAVRRLKRDSLISVVLPEDPSYQLNQFYPASTIGHHRLPPMKGTLNYEHGSSYVSSTSH